MVKLARDGQEGGYEAVYGFITRELSWVSRSCLRRGVRPQDVKAASHDAATIFLLHVREIKRWENFPAVMAYLAECIRTAARFHRAKPEEQLLDMEPPDRRFPLFTSGDVSRAMFELARPIADAIYLVYYEGYKYAEAAKALGCTLDSLKAKLKKGRQQLRELLEETSKQGSALFTNEKRKRFNKKEKGLNGKQKRLLRGVIKDAN
jgi:DNA-directed RNA polymerase specialized sigma24 family protein